MAEKTLLDKLVTRLQVKIIQENYDANDQNKDRITAFQTAIDYINSVFHTNYSSTKPLDYKIGDTIPQYKNLPLIDS